jgi:cell division protease FtsH
MNKLTRGLLTLAAAIVTLVAIFCLYQGPEPARQAISMQAFRSYVDAKQVSAVELRGRDFDVTFLNGAKRRVVGSLDAELTDKLAEQDIDVTEVQASSAGSGWSSLLSSWAPIVLLGLGFAFFYGLRRKGDNVFALRRSRHRTVKQRPQVRFSDVGGCEEAKRQLGDLVDFLANPKRWADAGVRPPRGVLLEGAPGCGKTLLARALAGETGASFLTVAGSEFVELFIGVGAARVRDLFESAAKVAPTVIFIDELDAIGRRRNSSLGFTNNELEAALNQLLVSLDGFQPCDRVVVLAATNRADILDPALVRAGRFDRRLRVPLLSRDARLQVLEIHTRGKSLAAEVSLPALADRTDGWTGAELETLVNEAALLALRRTREYGDATLSVRSEDFARALTQRAEGAGPMTQLDAALVESALKLSEPVGCARLRILLTDGSALEGELLWADSGFLKLRRTTGDTLIPKRQVRTIESLEPEPARLRLTAP